VSERGLLATDGSSYAEEALKCARNLARRDHAQVVVVHGFATVPSYLGEPSEDRAMARHVAVGNHVAGKAAQKLREAGLEVIVEVLEGPPADAVLRAADVRQCDVVVMGSRGHGD